MIEGLHFDVSGKELAEHCMARQAHHEERVRMYQAEIANIKAKQIEGMQYTNGNPLQVYDDKVKSHRDSAERFKFLAEHTLISETYRLSDSDLHKVEFVSGSRW